MHRIAQSWLVLQLTGDPRMLGLVVAAQFAPMLVLAPWAGVLADRHDRRRILQLTQIGMGAQALGLGLLTLLGYATGMWVLIAAAVLGVFTAIDGPARQSIVSDLVPPNEVVNAVALNSANFNAARLVGPAVAGLMIAAWGPGWVFLVNAATFAVMYVALSRIRLSAHKKPRRTGGMRDGLRYVRQRPDLWFVIALAGTVAMLVFNFPITIALMVSDEFAADARSYGVLASLMAVGSLTAALVQARRSRTDLRMVTLAAGSAGLTTILAGLMPSVTTFAAALVACGAAALVMMTGANSYLQTRSDDDHRSRVMSLYMAVFFGTTPVGAPVIGLLAEQFGPRAALLVPGVLSLLATAGLVSLYRMRSRALSRWPVPVRQTDRRSSISLSKRRTAVSGTNASQKDERERPTSPLPHSVEVRVLPDVGKLVGEKKQQQVRASQSRRVRVVPSPAQRPAHGALVAAEHVHVPEVRHDHVRSRRGGGHELLMIEPHWRAPSRDSSTDDQC